MHARMPDCVDACLHSLHGRLCLVRMCSCTRAPVLMTPSGWPRCPYLAGTCAPGLEFEGRSIDSEVHLCCLWPHRHKAGGAACTESTVPPVPRSSADTRPFNHAVLRTQCQQPYDARCGTQIPTALPFTPHTTVSPQNPTARKPVAPWLGGAPSSAADGGNPRNYLTRGGARSFEAKLEALQQSSLQVWPRCGTGRPVWGRRGEIPEGFCPGGRGRKVPSQAAAAAANLSKDAR
eukprot:363724-Chlamydomonas_euryale.AAC.8